MSCLPTVVVLVSVANLKYLFQGHIGFEEIKIHIHNFYLHISKLPNQDLAQKSLMLATLFVILSFIAVFYGTNIHFPPKMALIQLLNRKIQGSKKENSPKCKYSSQNNIHSHFLQSLSRQFSSEIRNGALGKNHRTKQRVMNRLFKIELP